MNYLEAKKKTAKDTFDEISQTISYKYTEKSFCQWLDENDELAYFRDEFFVPSVSAINQSGIGKLT